MENTQLKVGSRVFYSAHGVARVRRTEERQFGDAKQVFYVLELDRDVTVLLPVGKANAAIRDLVTAGKARELMQKLHAPPATVVTKLDHASRKRRAAVHLDGLQSGSPDRYTEILQELLVRSRSEKLSATEQRTLESARAYFVGEIGAVLHLTREQLDEDLRSVSAP